MTSKNYKLLQEQIFKKLESEGVAPSLLMHSCCAPCSSHCLEVVLKYFKTDIYYYNPNITVEGEYYKRLNEQIDFTKKVYSDSVNVISGEYEPTVFLSLVKGLENLKEGDTRCKLCYYLRLEKTAQMAKELGYDYFTTTLSVSPYKNANWLNEIGEELSKKYGVNYLYADFKKGGGYLRSIELSKKYGLYRQNYCGCEFSKK